MQEKQGQEKPSRDGNLGWLERFVCDSPRKPEEAGSLKSTEQTAVCSGCETDQGEPAGLVPPGQQRGEVGRGLNRSSGKNSALCPLPLCASHVHGAARGWDNETF